MLVKATRRRPWLWGVYVAMIVLPILIIIVACYLLRKPKRKKISRRIKKKNDDYTDDDHNEEEEEIEHDQREIKSKRNLKGPLGKLSSTSRKSRRRTRKE
jgi:flagellar biosynthesis/type III secretory pathway M-ring protein FliF/YscJ